MSFLIKDQISESNQLSLKNISFDKIYSKSGFDIPKIFRLFQSQSQLSKEAVLQILRRGAKLFSIESNLIKISSSVWVVGDIHGQYYDLLSICEKWFDFKKDTLLFLGDYVDRGCFSIEVMLSLIMLKLNNPSKIFLLRGNHESKQMTNYFNFHQECIKKYDQEVYEDFISVFNSLPLAAIVNESFLCLHGGLSSDIPNIDSIIKIDRFQEISNSGSFCDIVWADPTFQPKGQLKTEQIDNQQRGCSHIFGKELTNKFLQNNKLKCLIRGHQAEQQGYRLFHWDGQDKFPVVMTVFSAPNYCDFYNNRGACLRICDNQVTFEQYSQVAHPYVLPDFMDVFEWSFPFVAQKVSQMMFHLLRFDSSKQISEQYCIFDLLKQQMIKKIVQASKKQADSNREYILLEGRSLDNHLANDPDAKEFIKRSLTQDFETKRSIDIKYEKRPLFKSTQL